MIQIQRRQQFVRASARARKERMLVRPTGPLTYSVVNQSKGTAYTVRFVSINGKPFGQCSCPAGTPARADEIPMVCKHFAAAITVHIGLVRMECREMTRTTRMLNIKRQTAARERARDNAAANAYDASAADQQDYERMMRELDAQPEGTDNWMADSYDMQRD